MLRKSECETLHILLTLYTSSDIFLQMPINGKPLQWIGSSRKDLMDLPADVRRLFGFALSLAQAGDRHDAAKVLKGFGGAGVLEVVEEILVAPIAPCTRSSLPRQCLSFTAFRRKASAASPRRKKTWTLFTQGSKLPKRLQRSCENEYSID